MACSCGNLKDVGMGRHVPAADPSLSSFGLNTESHTHLDHNEYLVL